MKVQTQRDQGLIKNFTVQQPLRRVAAVSGISAQKRRPETTPLAPEPAFSSPAGLETAIARSQQYLLREQKPEGYWVGELMVDSTTVSDTIAYHHGNGKEYRNWHRKAANHIFAL